MSFDSSFTLCPSTKGAFSSYPDHKREPSSATPEMEKTKSILKNSFKRVSLIRQTELSSEQPQRVIAGTLIGVPCWEKTSSTQAPRAIRASPFEPLVHNRNFPKDGMISPHNFEECYNAQEHSRQHPNSAGHVRVPEISSDIPKLAQNEALPPVGEIRIPTPTLDAGESSTRKDDAEKTYDCEMENYKTLYFCGQRDLYDVHQKMSYVCEENRLLKRKLIEMQKQLFHVSRNKRRSVDANLAWSIPESSADGGAKRQRKAITPTEKVPVLQRTLSPLPIQSSHDSRGRSSPRVKFAPSTHGVPSSVSSEELTPSSD